MSDVVMTGGITNYKIKTVIPDSVKGNMLREVWGVLLDDSVYINSFPYSKLIGYNKILEKGYYSYFIGEPSIFKKEQISLGIIKEGEKKKGVCCKVAYVILNDGSVKWLNPELLKTLISDNNDLLKEFELRKVQADNLNEMFDFIKQYNKLKE